MMLVEAPEQALRAALCPEADRIVSPEVTYRIPDTRRKIRRPPAPD